MQSLAAVFAKNFCTLVKSDVAWKVEIVFKPISASELDIPQLFLIWWLDQVAKIVLRVHQLIYLTLVVMLQIREPVSDDFVKHVVQDLKLSNQRLL